MAAPLEWIETIWVVVATWVVLFVLMGADTMVGHKY